MTEPSPAPEDENDAKQGNGLGRRLAGNTIHVAIGRFAGLVLWLLLTPPILRSLGRDGFAVWALFFSLTGYLATLDLGLVQASLRHVAAARAADSQRNAGDLPTLSMLVFAALGAIWIAVGLAVAGPICDWLRVPESLQADASYGILVAAIVFMLGGAANVIMAVLQGYGRFDLSNLVILCVTATQGIALGLALVEESGLRGLMLGVLTAWLLGLILAITFLRLKVPRFRWSPIRSAINEASAAFRFGGPLQLAATLGTANVHVDKVLLARYATLATIVPYELGSRVATTLSALPQLLLGPVLSEAVVLHVAGARERLRELHERASHYYLSVTVLVLAPLLACADRIFLAWLGAPEPEAALVLRMLALQSGIALAAGMATTIARAMGRTKFEAIYAVIAVTTHVVLGVALVPRYGIRGALAAIILGSVVGVAYFFAAFIRLTGWSWWSSVVRVGFVPLVSLVVGVAGGAALDRMLPRVAGGNAWLWLGLSSAVTFGLTFALLLASRYLRWSEALAVVGGSIGMGRRRR
ncbi:MAG TPA: polysaccharide biosynthesis C-terminal domain-containing protein [Candidatus Limnocylindria bacterium]|nr:polysaccharide biosynthesis C-terminal domain-containing protein [Candidatus Limnocylindria bacterium]